uniref:Putative secreted protein n=1 Tax=Ixodes ricinus TaxID=34613 RepID=A0A6B0UJT6_IXORI
MASIFLRFWACLEDPCAFSCALLILARAASEECCFWWLPGLMLSSVRTFSKPLGPRLNSSTASATEVSTVLWDANSVFGQRFQINALKDSFAFCVFIREHLSSRSLCASRL